MCKKFDTENLNEKNYFRFDEGTETCVIIYPINILGVEMITQKQLQLMRAFRDRDEYSIVLWKESIMFDFITLDLAKQIITRLLKGEAIRFSFSKQEREDVKEACANFDKVYCNVILSKSLESVSLDYISNAFKFEPSDFGICGMDAYGSNEWVHFYNDGRASYSHSGNPKDVTTFNSHQECVDFIRIK